MDVSISDVCETEIDVYNTIVEMYSKYIDDKPLTKVITTINDGQIDIEMYFVKYAGNFAEGGRLKATKFCIDLTNKKIKTIEFFNGSSKRYGFNVDPIQELDLLNYKNALSGYYDTNNIYDEDLSQLNAVIKYVDDHKRVKVYDEDGLLVSDDIISYSDN